MCLTCSLERNSKFLLTAVFEGPSVQLVYKQYKRVLIVTALQNMVELKTNKLNIYYHFVEKMDAKKCCSNYYLALGARNEVMYAQWSKVARKETGHASTTTSCVTFIGS